MTVSGKFLAATLTGAVGVLCGFLAAGYLFAVDVDLLSVPYSNTPNELKTELTLIQGQNKLVIPAGAVVVHTRNLKDQRVYALEFVSEIAGEPISDRTAKREYFYAVQQK